MLNTKARVQNIEGTGHVRVRDVEHVFEFGDEGEQAEILSGDEERRMDFKGNETLKQSYRIYTETEGRIRIAEG